MNDVLIWWVLPGLVCFLLWIQVYRYKFEEELEDFKSSDWLWLTFVSILYPIGILFLIITTIVLVFPILIKTRTLKKEK